MSTKPTKGSKGKPKCAPLHPRSPTPPEALAKPLKRKKNAKKQDIPLPSKPPTGKTIPRATPPRPPTPKTSYSDSDSEMDDSNFQAPARTSHSTASSSTTKAAPRRTNPPRNRPPKSGGGVGTIVTPFGGVYNLSYDDLDRILMNFP